MCIRSMSRTVPLFVQLTLRPYLDRAEGAYRDILFEESTRSIRCPLSRQLRQHWPTEGTNLVMPLNYLEVLQLVLGCWDLVLLSPYMWHLHSAQLHLHLLALEEPISSLDKLIR